MITKYGGSGEYDGNFSWLVNRLHYSLWADINHMRNESRILHLAFRPSRVETETGGRFTGNLITTSDPKVPKKISQKLLLTCFQKLDVWLVSNWEQCSNGDDELSESVWIIHESLETFVWAELGLDADGVEAAGDLLGHPGEVQGDQRHHHVGPHWPGAQTPHPRVEVGEERGVDVLFEKNIFKKNEKIFWKF